MRKSRYQFLPRRDRNAIDLVTPELLVRVLECGEVRTFNTIIGLLQDLKDVTGRVGEDREKCLRLPMVLFKAATEVSQVIIATDNCDKVE